MLQFVSNQVGEFPDLFSEQLCSSFPSGSAGGGSGSNGSGGSNGSSGGSGAGDPLLQRSFSQVPLPSFSSSATSSQAPALQVKVSPTTVLTPPRATPVLQPRPQPQPQAQLQQQTVMITPTFSTAPQTRIIQQPLIYQNAATSFQGDSQVRYDSGGLVQKFLCQFPCTSEVDGGVQFCPPGVTESIDLVLSA